MISKGLVGLKQPNQNTLGQPSFRQLLISQGQTRPREGKAPAWGLLAQQTLRLGPSLSGIAYDKYKTANSHQRHIMSLQGHWMAMEGNKSQRG